MGFLLCHRLVSSTEQFDVVVFVSQASRHLFVPAFARYSGVLVAIEAMALA
jgi:hypothetical protein